MNRIVEGLDRFYNVISKYDLDLFICIGFVSTLIQAMWKKMKLIECFKLFIMACFMGYGIFKMLGEYTPLSHDVIVISSCGASGFARQFLEQFEIIIKSVGENTKKIIDKLIDKI